MLDPSTWIDFFASPKRPKASTSKLTVQEPTASVNTTPIKVFDAHSPVLNYPVIKRNDPEPSQTSPDHSAKLEPHQSAQKTPPLQTISNKAPLADSLKTPVKTPVKSDADPKSDVSAQPVTDTAKDFVAQEGRPKDLPVVSSTPEPPVDVEPNPSTPVNTIPSSDIVPPVAPKTLSPVQPTPAQPVGPMPSKSEIGIENEENEDIHPLKSISSDPLVPNNLVSPQPSKSAADLIKLDISVPEPPVDEGVVTTALDSPARSPPSSLKVPESVNQLTNIAVESVPAGPLNSDVASEAVKPMPVAAAERVSQDVKATVTSEPVSETLADGPTQSSHIIKQVDVEKTSAQVIQPSKKKRPVPLDSQPVPKRVTRSRVRAQAEQTLDVNINDTNVRLLQIPHDCVTAYILNTY